jgi:type I restriction enzyme, R subunit
MSGTEHPDYDKVGFTGTEREQSQLPAVALLSRLGYHYLTREEALALRGGKASRILLEDVLRAQLSRLNRIRYKGREEYFSQANIRRAIQALDDVPLVEGMQRAGEQAYDLLRLGKSLEQTIEGDTKSFTLRYIDWENPANNVFHATTEYALLRAGSEKHCYLDVALFVNGIPFVVIECKRRDVAIEEAISDILAYQSADFVPELFKYVQIVVATNVNEAKYATAGTEAKFWAVWKSRQDAVDVEIEARLLQPLPATEREAVLSNFVQEERQFYAVEQQGRQTTEQDRALYNLCRPERLIELVGRFILYDGGIKKIARYQQYDAVKRTMARITSPTHPRAASELGQGVGLERSGGVIWHTQGSGKSLTMVLLANAIALSKEIENPRIILVTDRVDLDKQIAGTFYRCGLEPKRATSGADLRRLVADTRAGVITTLVQKFQAALLAGEFVDDSPDIFVLVDESHRTQYGTLNAQMKRIFPHACYIGFTGTPLLRRDKSTVAKFGGLIDTYGMRQAVEDKAVAPLLYERRHVPQDVRRDAIDRWFDRVCEGLSAEQKKDLKKKYSSAEPLLKTDERLREIAYDVFGHYCANWQRANGFKAQIVAPDRLSAIKLNDYIEDLGKTSGQEISTAVVISLNRDDREGYEEVNEPISNRVTEFGKKIEQRYRSEEHYDENIINDFKHAAQPEILIVVDKLLTGFDAPCNTVLYLARRLANHSLLQAIARVNRLYPGKEFGYILDYVGVLGELDRALNEYAALAGYDLADIEGTIHSIREQLQVLPQRRADLLDIFKTLPNKSDEEAYERFLADDEIRKDFYETLVAYSKCLKIALSTELFYEQTPEEVIDRYKADLRRFQRLRSSVQQRYADTVDMRVYEPQIEKLLNTYVRSDAVEILMPKPVDIFDTPAMEAALDQLGSKTTAAKADTIAHATARTITERMDEDPALYRKFSEMIEETIQAFRNDMIGEMDYLQRVLDIRGQVVSRTTGNVPSCLAHNDVAQAYYRLVLERLDAIAKQAGNREIAVDVALMIDTSIRHEVVVDWRQKNDVQNRMRANIDDGFYELSEQGKIELNWAALDEIAGEALRVARSRIA